MAASALDNVDLFLLKAGAVLGILKFALLGCNVAVAISGEAVVENIAT